MPDATLPVKVRDKSSAVRIIDGTALQETLRSRLTLVEPERLLIAIAERWNGLDVYMSLERTFAARLADGDNARASMVMVVFNGVALCLDRKFYGLIQLLSE